MPLKHKFHAKPCEIDDIKFSSKLEAAYYRKLSILQASGEVLFFLMQVPFGLPGNIKYRCDFQIFWKDGTITFVDVKGVDTPVSKIKRQQVEALYPVKIHLYPEKKS